MKKIQSISCTTYRNRSYLNIKPKSVKLLKKVEAYLCDFGLGKDFLDIIPKASSAKEQIDKDFKIFSIKNFCSLKDTIRQMKRQDTNWEKIFAKHVSDKGLVPRMYSGE